jgi:hypothetical protein
MSMVLQCLETVPRQGIVDLMSDPRVIRHMVTRTGFPEGDCESFLRAKREQWREFGYGVME